MGWLAQKFDAAALPAARAVRAGCGPVPGASAEPRSRRGKWRAIALLFVHVLIALHVWHWLASGESVTPLEPSEAGQTLTEGIVNAGFILFALAILSTLIFGRFFCGWACHVVALQDGCAWLLRKLGIEPKPVRSRALAYVPLVVALWMFVVPSVLQLASNELPQSLTVELVTVDFWARFPGPFVAGATFLAVGGLAVWLLGSKGFCTYGCPYGAVFAFADRFAKGRIRVTDDCNGCSHCTAVCTSGVSVHTEVRDFGKVVDAGCMKCMDCVSACPKDALYFGLKQRQEIAPRPARATKPKTSDFTGTEELVMGAVFVATLVFAYSRLYGVVPLLLGVALAVFAAVASVVAIRLVKQRDFVLQHHVLRRAGRLTARGAAAVGVLVLFFAFTSHSAVARHHDIAAQDGARALRAGFEPDLARGVVGHLEWLRRFGLWHAPELDLERAGLLRRLGESERAEAALVAAIARLDDSERARFELFELLIERREFARASAEFEALLDHARPRAIGDSLFQVVVLLEAELCDATAISNAARAALVRGDRAAALERLQRLESEYPLDPRTGALRSAIESKSK